MTSIRSFMRPAFAGLAATAALAAAGCTPEPGPTTPTTTEAPTTTQAPSTDIVVSDATLTWAYNQYAHYGVFGAWCQTAAGERVSLSEANGQAVSGDAVDASKTFKLGNFTGGSGVIDAETGAGTISWGETGTWTLNAYCGQFGAPDETLSDPVLTINAGGSGTLSFEAFIPAGTDMNGNPSPAAGPERIAIATFSASQLQAAGFTAKPDFAGRAYTAPGSETQTSVDCDGVGGSWPSEWINFIPSSVRSHYYTTSCAGLNLKKPPLAFSVAW